MSAIDAQIAKLENLLNSAMTSVSTDGQHYAFDLDAARRRLAELKQQKAKASPIRTSTIRLDGGFGE